MIRVESEFVHALIVVQRELHVHLLQEFLHFVAHFHVERPVLEENLIIAEVLLDHSFKVLLFLDCRLSARLHLPVKARTVVRQIQEIHHVMLVSFSKKNNEEYILFLVLRS